MGVPLLANFPTASKVVISESGDMTPQKIFDDSVNIFLVADASEIPTVNHLRITQNHYELKTGAWRNHLIWTTCHINRYIPPKTNGKKHPERWMGFPDRNLRFQGVSNP